MATQFLTRFEVQARYRVSRSSLYRWIERGLFPPPAKIGPRMVRWRLSDLEKFEEERGASDE